MENNLLFFIIFSLIYYFHNIYTLFKIGNVIFLFSEAERGLRKYKSTALRPYLNLRPLGSRQEI